MQSPVKFYVLAGSMALTLFAAGCANDTAIYSDPSTHGQTPVQNAAPEEGTPPTPTEQTTAQTTTPPEENKTPEVTEEKKMPPPVNNQQPKPWQPAPTTTNNAAAPAAVSYPKAVRVPGKPNRVISPYAPYAGEVDVGGFASGDQVKCPYTGKIFIVP
jgi:hypothetical protein